MTRHQLDPSPSTTADVFSRDLPPVLTVDPGDTIVLRSLNASGHLQPQTFPGENVPTMTGKRRRGHCLTGPIAVRGAVPGEVLAVRFASLRPDTWGYTAAGGRDTPLTRRLGLHEGPPAWLLWQIDVDAGVATSDLGHTVRIAPFHGVTGVAWDEPGEHSTIPPRAVGGGNIDCRELVAGSVLYLPVAVPGALLSIGDGHAAQGDGEVAGTAIECGMTSEVQLELVTERPVPGVHAEAPAGQDHLWLQPGSQRGNGRCARRDADLAAGQLRSWQGNGAGAGQPGTRPEGHAGGERVLGRSCAASGGRDQVRRRRSGRNCQRGAVRSADKRAGPCGWGRQLAHALHP